MSIVSRLINRPESFSIEMLQRGVQSGTIPAYIGIPLIQEKLKDKQEMDNAQSARMAAQTPPPVANQVMAQAAQATQPQLQPQPQVTPPGLMGLRSNLPAKFAGGGIVSFADGGDVERYQVGGGTGSIYDLDRDPLIRRLREAAPNDPKAQADREAMLNTLRKLKAAGMDIGTLPGRAIAGAAESVITRPLRALGVPVPYLPESFYGGDRASMTPYMDQLRATEPQPAAQPSAAEVAQAMNAGPAAPTQGAPTRGAPTRGALTGGAAAAGTPAAFEGPFAIPQKPSGPSMVDTTQKMLYGTETEPGFFARAATRQAELDKKVQEAEGKVTGKAYEGLEANLRKEAEQMGADKEQAKYMAMFKAGLAMMAGTSRHALENIGKGAMVGAEDYQKAAADIKKAQKENQRMMANIEQARRAEAIGDRDRAVVRLDKASEAEERRDMLGVNAIMSATGQDRSNATELWKTQYATAGDIYRTNLAGQYQLRAAEARANRPAGITPAQLAQLRLKAQDRVDMNAVRGEVAKTLKLSKTPQPGQDAAFDKRVQDLYAQRIDQLVAGLLGGSTGANAPSFAGFKLLGPEE